MINKEKKGYPLYNPQDNFNSTVSSCDMTGLEPAPPRSEAEAESYATLAGVPVPENAIDARREKKK